MWVHLSVDPQYKNEVMVLAKRMNLKDAPIFNLNFK